MTCYANDFNAQVKRTLAREAYFFIFARNLKLPLLSFPKIKVRPLFLFYLLVVYVLMQFSWWAYLLINLNREAYSHKIEMLAAMPVNISERNQKQLLLEKELDKKWLMVIGEGIVFFSLLLLGIHQIRKSFHKKYMLAMQQKNFLISITHEFKSPLAAIKLSLQTLQKHTLEKEKTNAIIFRSLNETERLDKLVENALIAARIEGHNVEFHKENFNLSGLLSDLTEHSEGKIITAGISENIYMYGDVLAISSLALNLIENAEKYSPPQSPVHVELSEAGNDTILKVSDKGIGIPESEKSRIFEKFYRIGNENIRKSRGAGLGLYIVKHVAALHHGKITVKDNAPAGTVFEIKFRKEKTQL